MKAYHVVFGTAGTSVEVEGLLVLICMVVNLLLVFYMKGIFGDNFDTDVFKSKSFVILLLLTLTINVVMTIAYPYLIVFTWASIIALIIALIVLSFQFKWVVIAFYILIGISLVYTATGVFKEDDPSDPKWMEGWEEASFRALIVVSVFFLTIFIRDKWKRRGQRKAMRLKKIKGK